MLEKGRSFIYTKKAKYNDDQIGHIMREEYISIKNDMTVSEAMSKLISGAAHIENIQSIFVTDQLGQYIGYIPLTKLIIARKQTPLNSIITTNGIYFHDEDSIDFAVSLIDKDTPDCIPVMDKESNKLIGILTISDIAFSAEEMFENDYAKFASLTDDELTSNNIKDSIKKRAPWLLILLVLSVFVSATVGLFEEITKEMAWVVCFQSLILGMAGNAGTQALAVTIREISTNHRTNKSVILKEAKIGSVNGSIIGGISFAILLLYFMLLKGFSFTVASASSAVISVSMFISMILSSIIGVVIPIFFKRIGIDPAVASGPLITTFNDLCSVCVFYSLCFLGLIYLFDFTIYI